MDTSAEETISAKNLEIERQARRISDLEHEASDAKARMKLVETEIDRAKREETRWKERYRLMEASKDERIHLLEDSLSKMRPK